MVKGSIYRIITMASTTKKAFSIFNRSESMDSPRNRSSNPTQDTYTSRQSPRLDRENTSLPPISRKQSEDKFKPHLLELSDEEEASSPVIVRRKSLKGNILDFSDHEVVSSCPDLTQTRHGDSSHGKASPVARIGSTSSEISQRSGVSAPCNSPRQKGHTRHGHVGKMSPLTLDFTEQQMGNFADSVANKFKEKQKSARMRDSQNSSPVSTPGLRRRNTNVGSTKSLTSLPPGKRTLKASMSSPLLYGNNHDRNSLPTSQNNIRTKNGSIPQTNAEHKKRNSTHTKNDTRGSHNTSDHPQIPAQILTHNNADATLKSTGDETELGMTKESFDRCQMWLREVEDAKEDRSLNTLILPPVQWPE